MPGKGKWAVTPNAARKRPIIQVSLAPETIESLRLLAEQTGETRSRLIEAAIVEYLRRRKPPNERKE